MYDETDLVREIQRISDKERRASNPSGYLHGKVVSASPLKIKTDTNITLDEDFLILPQRLTNWALEASFNGGTKQKLKLYNALEKGDNVILIQQDGGQEFLVYDRERD